MHKIHIYGMVRSGNHAIINWIGLNHGNSVVHFNNMYVLNNVLCAHCSRSIPNIPTAITTYGTSYSYIVVTKGKKYKKYYKQILDQQFDLTIISHENVDIGVLENIDDNDFLIVRDPYNWIASIFSHQTMSKNLGYRLPMNDKLERLIQAYIDNFKYPINIIYFNSWFQYIDYRKCLADKLNLCTHDNGVDYVAEHGNGSSFDQLELQDNASKMFVLNRYKHYIDNQDFWDIFDKYPELKRISSVYFGINI